MQTTSECADRAWWSKDGERAERNQTHRQNFPHDVVQQLHPPYHPLPARVRARGTARCLNLPCASFRLSLATVGETSVGLLLLLFISPAGEGGEADMESARARARRKRACAERVRGLIHVRG